MADTGKTEHKVPPLPKRKITVNGITLTIDPNVFNNYEFSQLMWMENAPENMGGNIFAYVPLFHMICGDDYDKVLSQLKKRGNGIVKTDDVADLITKIMQKIAPNS